MMGFINIKRTAYLLGAVIILSSAFPLHAKAQGLNNNAWAPQASNRASIAALIRQVENSRNTQQQGTAGQISSNVTQLICGSNSGEGKESSARVQTHCSYPVT